MNSDVCVRVMMPSKERADFCIHSLVDGLLDVLQNRVEPKSGRYDRLTAMRKKQMEIISSYSGDLPKSFEPITDKCLATISDAINGMLKSLKVPNKPTFAPNGALTTAKKENNMTKAELIEVIAGETNLTKKAVGDVIVSFCSAISTADKTTLVGFGTFKQTTRAARTGRNPQTGAAIQIPEKTILTFKASK